MSSPAEWDVEQYKMEHECDEHWELRRRFLVTHKNSFPEDELVCLAQVFTNVEFLGCRYPEETMQLVAELSQEVASDYREKQKSKLQRTFVKASDAAGAKVKGLNKPSNSGNKLEKFASTNFHLEKNTGVGYPVEKKIKLDKFALNENINNHKKKNNSIPTGPFGNIVIFERLNDSPVNVLTCATNVSGANLEWKFDNVSTGCKCEVLINSTKLTEGLGTNQKSAKKAAATASVQELQKYYYTIKVKKAFDGGTESVVNSTSLSNAAPGENPLSDDNIGRKLMMLMGWGGGGLGKSQQGIAEPITVKQQVSREGLGLKMGMTSRGAIKKKCQDMLREYMQGDMMTDLVFSSEFSNEERALIHQVARQMGVKSHSHGPKDSRTLVVSRKVDPFELVAELKEIGGTTEKYQLIEPTGS